MTSGKDLEIIGYKINKMNSNQRNVITELKCLKCNNEMEKKIDFDKITHIKCDKCKFRWSIIPLEISYNNNDLIDFRIESYQKIAKILREGKITTDISNIQDKSKREQLKLSYIQKYFREKKIK